MMEAHSDVLTELLPTASPISFRFAYGDIPGTSPDGRTNALNVFVYANAGRKAVLMTAVASDKGWHVLNDYYVLAQGAKGWEVVDGNGGQATYAAVAAFANDNGRLAMHSIPRNRLHAGEECRRTSID